MVRMPPEVQGLASALLHFQPFLILALTPSPPTTVLGWGLVAMTLAPSSLWESKNPSPCKSLLGKLLRERRCLSQGSVRALETAKWAVL